MIALTFKIIEVGDGRITLEACGGSRMGASNLESDFTKKLLVHINRFNTSYKKIHRRNKIRMKELKQ